MQNCSALTGFRFRLGTSIACLPFARSYLSSPPPRFHPHAHTFATTFRPRTCDFARQRHPRRRNPIRTLSGIFSTVPDGEREVDKQLHGDGSAAQAADKQFGTDDRQKEATQIERATIDLEKDVGALLKSAQALKEVPNKPEICTAEELHYVAVPGTDWRLALWRYPPRPQAPTRNHPLLLLSGVGTNAVGFDLDPSASLARFMSEDGFDTWILEVRGAGLSKRGDEPPVTQISDNNGAVGEVNMKLSKNNRESVIGAAAVIEKSDTSSWASLHVATTVSNSISRLSEGLRNLLNDRQSQTLSSRLVERIYRILEEFQLSERYAEMKERLTGILEEGQSSAITTQLTDLSKRLAKLLEEGQRSVSPQLYDLQDRLISTIDDFQKLLDLITQYDWDFDNYLEEDVPAAMDYIRSQSKPRDGKLHALGHSMGGIILYALLATRGEDCGLVSAVTVASSLDYGVSDSSLKLLLPFADPAQALNVPAVPLGTMMAAIHPFASHPPYVLGWLNSQVSARDMMDPDLFKKLVLNNFCTVPAKLLLQLTTVFQCGGLRNRSGAIIYKENLWRCKTPVLAIAGDEDLICPPAAVLDTVKELPQDLATYKLFGGQGDKHYGHYDLVCGRKAKQDVHPLVRDFFIRHDHLEMLDE